MFSELSKIFTISPRHAEQTDTRQAIQRHEPDFERRRAKKQPESETDDHKTGASVSVEALRIFLEEFLRNNSEEPANQKSSKEENTTKPPQHVNRQIPQDHPYTNPAAQAAGAYANTAHTGEKSAILFETTDQAGDGPALEISAADIRTIQTLIDDLKILEDAGIEILHIERAATFLDSLNNAVAKIKTSL